MWPCKNVSHSRPSSVNYFFPTSPIKLKLGLRIGGRLLIAKPPEPIIMISQSEIGSSSQITFVTLFSGTLFWQVLDFAVPFTSLSKMWKAKLLCQNHFAEPSQ